MKSFFCDRTKNTIAIMNPIAANSTADVDIVCRFSASLEFGDFVFGLLTCSDEITLSGLP